MKKFLTLAFFALALAGFFSADGWAQPDPRDTVILESKTVMVGEHPGTGTDTAAYAYMKVSITNKDTLQALVVALKETSLGNGAYLILARPRNFNGVVSRLTTTLTFLPVMNALNYHSDNPDSFSVAMVYDPTDELTKEPPNSTRKDFLEFKFDSARVDVTLNGQVEFDTARVANQPTGYVNNQSLDVSVNFVKAIWTIERLDVKDVKQGQRPTSYSLSQNYPNPFNANTQIQFALPKAGKTRLEVFNVLGQRVNTLVDEFMEAGYKIVNWDGRDHTGQEVPSGIYFYRLRSEGFLQTKKMLIIQ